MPERPTARQNQPANPDQRRSLKGRRGDKGLYTRLDSDAFLLNTMVPVLARSLGAAEPTLRGMRGLYGSFDRSVTRHHTNGDVTYYNVSATRLSDIDTSGQKRGQITAEIRVSLGHALDEQELITEWPLIEELGVADDLQLSAVERHINDIYDMEEPVINLDDPLLQIELATHQADALEVLTSREFASEELLGMRLNRYIDHVLSLAVGRRPILNLAVGYETDDKSYEVPLLRSGQVLIVGDTEAEIQQFSWLKEETSRNAEDEIMQEFEEALIAVGILSARVKKRAPIINSTVQRR